MSQLRRQGQLRFDFLDGAIPGGIAPTDIDQCLERYGRFLFIEGKRPGQVVPRGQAITFDALTLRPIRSAHLLVVVGNPPDEIEAARWWHEGATLHPTTTEGVRQIAARWWQWASKR